MKVKLLEWPFYVRSIIGPSSLAYEYENELVLAALSDLKPLIVSRAEANRDISRECGELEDDNSITTYSSLHVTKKVEWIRPVGTRTKGIKIYVRIFHEEIQSSSRGRFLLGRRADLI
ncbi:hypothetical protein KPH14_001398 [Odynerus spinipes]|uniref:Uncharacterized protein n=1 Tax=Odynerus spinipes TaxID=1348599 RepID=A0AAD9VLN2_9HYME|nr:hypothetical protein KPH14_001398 [Odynerus spinipes]